MPRTPPTVTDAATAPYAVAKLTARQQVNAWMKADPTFADRVVRAFAPNDAPRTLACPADAARLLRPLVLGHDRERAAAVALSSRRNVLHVEVLTIGTESCTIVEPRTILQWAFRHGAASIILAHNHPSGDPTPSDMDRQVTERLTRAASTVGLSLLDHLILTDTQHYSMAEGGLLPWTDNRITYTG